MMNNKKIEPNISLKWTNYPPMRWHDGVNWKQYLTELKSTAQHREQLLKAISHKEPITFVGTLITIKEKR